MSIQMADFDYSPEALLPGCTDSDKVRIVCEVIRQLAHSVTCPGLTQQELQTIALQRYTFISKTYSLPQVDHMAFMLYSRGGVDVQTAKAYYSYALTPEDAKRWTIITF